MRALRGTAALSVVVLVGLAGMWGTEVLLARSQADGTATTGEVRQTPVTVVVADRRALVDSVSAVGTIYPARSIELRPLAEGRLTEVSVTSGETLAEGAEIVALDARAARAAVARAEATLAAAQDALERISALSDRDVAADARLEGARAEAARAEADLAMAQADLEDRRLTAPFDGRLGIVTLDLGGYVDTSTVITTLTDLTEVEVELPLPEAYYSRVNVGQAVRLTSSAYPDRTFTGSVAVRAPSVDPDTRSFDIRARIDNPGRRLVGGMFVEAEIVFARREAVTVPDDAVISEAATTYVYTVSDGQARRQDVGVGARLGERTEITRGIEPGTEVVVAGWDSLSDGAAVTVREAVPTDALN